MVAIDILPEVQKPRTRRAVFDLIKAIIVVVCLWIMSLFILSMAYAFMVFLFTGVVFFMTVYMTYLIFGLISYRLFFKNKKQKEEHGNYHDFEI